mmetsp:Transcript_10441/g.24832  ORF Transcript_10441/g.24832 Transcript_10441/m.24832 type:complete len:134 (+) Transcript_10441:95-496(+)
MLYDIIIVTTLSVSMLVAAIMMLLLKHTRLTASVHGLLANELRNPSSRRLYISPCQSLNKTGFQFVRRMPSVLIIVESHPSSRSKYWIFLHGAIHWVAGGCWWMHRRSSTVVSTIQIDIPVLVVVLMLMLVLR